MSNNTSRHKIWDIIKKIKIPVWLLDASGTQLMVNPAVCKMIGLDAETILRTDCRQLFCKEPEVPAWCPLQKAISEQKPATCGLSLNNREYTIDVEPLFDDNGKMIRILKTAVDITDRVAAERREQESRRILQALLDNLPMAVMLKDADNEFRYLLCNPAYCDMVGRNRADLIGKNDAETGIFPGREKELRTLDEKAIAENRVLHSTVKLTFQHSGRIVCERFKIPLAGAGGRKLLLVAYMDVTRLNNFVESEKTINQSLEHVVVEPDFIKNSAEVMRSLAKHMECDRITLMNYDLQADNYCELHRITTTPEKESSEISAALRMQMLERLSDRLKQNQIVEISDIAKSPVADLMADTGLLSLSAAPVFAGKDYCGALLIGFSSYRRVFSEIDHRIMRSMANIISLAIIRKRQMTELKLADREKQLILNNIRIPIWLYDADGQLVRVNSAVSKMTGLDEQTLLATPCREVVCKNILEENECPVKNVIAFNKSSSRKLHYKDRDYILTAEPITDDSGRLINIVKSAVDVTEIEEAKRQQEAAAKRAEEASKAKSYFIASVSHELRTPLNAVLGFAELLHGTDFPQPTRMEYLENISSSGKMLLQLINNVLDITKMEAGNLELAESPVDFPLVCNDVAAMFSRQIAQKNLKVDIHSQPMPELQMDMVRMRQILFNLIGNAVKFTDAGRIELVADFRPESDGSGTLTIRVSDTGPGIPPNIRDGLFKPFSAASAMRGAHASGSGTGLGLALTARMLELMGGSITLEKSSSHGSVFAVEIRNLKIVPDTHEETAAPDSTPRCQTAASHSGTRLLLVDDMVMNLKIISVMLKKTGAKIDTAQSGAEALALLRQNQYDMVLTDLWMPEMNGEEFAAEVKKNPDWRNMPIAAVTADVENKNNFNLENFAAVITKPVTMSTLLATIPPPRCRADNAPAPIPGETTA
ncbi:MAG: PAS domain-containing protein [Victivallaceae bacterium]|nr:PAS domain-containing protein [Victivallaceae bacterium]